MPQPNHFGLGWAESDWGRHAQTMRNRSAKSLRKEGYTVTTKTLDFTDLARDRAAILEAHMPGTEKSPMGCATTYVRS